MRASAQSRTFLSLKKGQPLRQTPSPPPGGSGLPALQRLGRGWGGGTAWEVLPAVSPWARERVVSYVMMWPGLGRVIATTWRSCH